MYVTHTSEPPLDNGFLIESHYKIKLFLESFKQNKKRRRRCSEVVH